MNFSLFKMTETVFCGDSVLWILRVPPDGNCLFSSLAHQIFFPETVINGVPAAEFLRSTVINFIRRNLSVYSPSIIAEAFEVQDALHLSSDFSFSVFHFVTFPPYVKTVSSPPLSLARDQLRIPHISPTLVVPSRT